MRLRITITTLCLTAFAAWQSHNLLPHRQSHSVKAHHHPHHRHVHETQAGRQTDDPHADTDHPFDQFNPVKTPGKSIDKPNHHKQGSDDGPEKRALPIYENDHTLSCIALRNPDNPSE